MKRAKSRIRPLLAPVLLATVMGTCGCQWMAPQSRPDGVDVVRVDRATLEDEYRKLSAFVADVEEEREAAQRELAKRSIELENERETNRQIRGELETTLIDLDFLESQFITLERQLSQDESKATAVAAMADAQVIYDRLRQAGAATRSDVEWRKVDEQMAAAEAAAEMKNFTAAVYYAHRATRLLDRSERRSKSFLSSGSPRVVSVAAANYRKGPGEEFPVLGTLAYGVVVVEIDRKLEWVRMKTRTGVEGWIHEKLLH